MTSTIKVNNIQNQCGANIINESSNTITIGASGDTVSLASGASQSGFGRTGTVDWQTGSIKTATFTATSGEGYFCNTTSGTFTMNLPAGSAGAIVSVQDYNNTFDSNALTVDPNGSEKINGGTGGDPVELNTEGQGVTFVYIDSTVGWRSIQDNTYATQGQVFITATGGTITTCGNDKIHTFTGPGTFCVSTIASTPANNQLSYSVVAGGGGAGESASGSGHPGGGGGAGGFREDKSPVTPYTASPLEGAGTINATVTGFPITVGAGGGGGSGPTGGPGVDGSNSVFSTITSAGGGGGGTGSNPGTGRGGNVGGSGGGSGSSNSPSVGGGAGNTPPVSPPQGNNGGPGAQTSGKGGSGGGATAAGSQTPDGNQHLGGCGATTSITASPVTYSAGGAVASNGGAGTTNRGNGGNALTNGCGGAGGSGIVIIRYKFQ